MVLCLKAWKSRTLPGFFFIYIRHYSNPNFPVAGSMPESVGKAIESLENINSINIKLVWQPKWTKDLMSEDAKLALDFF